MFATSPVNLPSFRRSRAPLGAVVLSALLAACGGGGSHTTPSVPGTSAASPASSAKATAQFTVLVPPATKQSASLKPAYVSPATQSMTVSVLQGSTSVFNQTVGLTASSTGCASSLAGVTCTLSVGLAPGSYTASISTYDGANGAGNVLSTAQNVAFTLTAGQNNVIPLTLSGIPTNIIASSAGQNAVYVLAQDVDGNFIVGAGAPTFTATGSGATVATITQPTATAPNKIGFAVASPAPAPGTETVNVTASYPSGETNACAQPGAVCTLAPPITVAYTDGTAFTANYEDNNVLGFTLPLTSNTQSPSVTISGVTYYPYWGIALGSSGEVFSWGYDPTDVIVSATPPYTSPVSNTGSGIVEGYGYGAVAPNGDLFIPEYPTTTGAVGILAPPYTGAVTAITTGIDYPYATATDSSSNLYVANEASSSVTVYAPPYTGAPITLSTSAAPYSVNVTSSNLFVGESGKIDVFTLPVSGSSTPAATFTIKGSYYSLATDPSGNLWAGCYQYCGAAGTTEGGVYEFTKPFTTGESASVSLPMPTAPFTSYYTVGVAFDASGNLYVDNGYGGAEDGGLLEYTGTITSSSKPTYGIETSNLYYPWGLVIAPPTFTVTP